MRLLFTILLGCFMLAAMPVPALAAPTAKPAAALASSVPCAIAPSRRAMSAHALRFATRARGGWIREARAAR